MADETIRIDALPPTDLEARENVIPSMLNGVTVHLTVAQILGLLLNADLPSIGADAITVDPSWGGSATDVQAALAEALTTLAPKTRTISAGTGLTGGGDLSANRSIAASVASQAQAEAGTATHVLMTPQRTQQAIAAQASVGLVLLGTQTVSGAASLDLTGIFTTNYDHYVILLSGIAGSVDNQNLLTRFGRSGSPLTGSNYRYAGQQVSSDGTSTYRTSGTSATNIEIANSVQNSAGRGGRARIEVFSPADTVNSAGIISHSSHASSALWRDQTMSGAYFDDVLAMNDIQFYMSSGNISGTAVVYGYRKP